MTRKVATTPSKTTRKTVRKTAPRRHDPSVAQVVLGAIAQTQVALRVPLGHYRRMKPVERVDAYRAAGQRDVTLYVDPTVEVLTPGSPPAFSTYGLHNGSQHRSHGRAADGRS